MAIQKLEPLKFLKIDSKCPLDNSELIAIKTLPIDSFYIDRSYQRMTTLKSRRMIEKIAREWSWKKCDFPKIVIKDGMNLVIDGQHTILGAMLREDIHEIPCVIISEKAALAEQAELFVSKNTNRTNVNPIRVYKANIIAKDAHALALNEMLEEYGISIVDSPTGEKHESQAISSFFMLYNKATKIQVSLVLSILIRLNLELIRAIHIKIAFDAIRGKYGSLTTEEIILSLKQVEEKLRYKDSEESFIKSIKAMRKGIIDEL